VDKESAGQLFSSCRDQLHISVGHCLEVCRVALDVRGGDQVGYRYGYPLVWHAEVCVHDSPQVARGGCLVEPGAGRVLGPAVNGVKAAAQAGPGEVAGHERQPTSAGVAGDDVVGVIDMRGVAR